MTNRYLAAHSGAPTTAKRAKKPGGAEPAADARSQAAVHRPALSKPIRKEKKKARNSVLTGPKHDSKSS